MRIGILGSGLMASKLGTIFARAGHDVVFSYSHSERKLKFANSLKIMAPQVGLEPTTPRLTD